MFGLKYKVWGSARIFMNSGTPKFEYMTANNFDLMFIIICFFLKMRWMFTDQMELEELKNVYSAIIKKYPSSIDGVSEKCINHSELDGETILNILVNKAGDIGITSDFPFHYSNSSIINIGMIYMDKIYQVLNEPEKTVFKIFIEAFDSLMQDDDKDTSNNRLMDLFDCVSIYRKGMYKKMKKAGIIKF